MQKRLTKKPQLPSAKDNVHVYIYTKIKNNSKRLYMIKHSDTSKQGRTFALRFYSQNPDTLRYAVFHETFFIGIYIYTKSMTFCVT